MKMADDYLKRAEELRQAGVVQAAFPEHSDANASAVLRLLIKKRLPEKGISSLKHCRQLQGMGDWIVLTWFRSLGLKVPSIGTVAL
jgi:hypothetical protein